MSSRGAPARAGEHSGAGQEVEWSGGAAGNGTWAGVGVEAVDDLDEADQLPGGCPRTPGSRRAGETTVIVHPDADSIFCTNRFAVRTDRLGCFGAVDESAQAPACVLDPGCYQALRPVRPKRWQER
ncbi:hypothetical protein GCM10010430_51370 [Kitasatospora cystarginea]|uniref:Uncharacterized protein n=1 Tax=Kitasatospora cystarginea TaxID=58350 RepID=A0ABP5RJ88_9ACTN